MTVWKSPVLYLGVLLVLAVAGALAAPFIINWDSYRTELEDYGRRITGREVTIAGAISASLFPWPSLTVENVHIANPPGMSDPEFAEAARITAHMQLAGLISGSILVESIEIDQPTVTLERQPAGQGNWNFQMGGDVSEVLGRIRLDQVRLSEATVRLIDRRRAPGVIELRMPSVSLASQSLAGPWRLTADQVEASGRNFALSLSTSTWTPEQPLQFYTRVTGVGGTGLAYTFEGAVEPEQVKGVLEIMPAAPEDAKSDPEGQVRPIVFRSNVTATFDAVALDSIAVAPRNPKDGGTIAAGSAKIAITDRIAAQVDLSAPRIDLEQLAGAGAYTALREGGHLALIDAFLGALPEGVDLAGSIKVGSLKAGGETFENMTLRGEASREVIRLREISASLPGRSRALFQDAVFFPGKVGSEIAGQLAFESSDLKQFTQWLWPEAKADIAKIWTGNRGRLKFQTNASLSSSELKLARMEYEMDGLPGTVDFAVALGGKGNVNLKIAAEKLDIDAYAPGGIAAAASPGQSGLATLLSYLAPGKDSRDLRLSLQAGELALNGISASDVVVDLDSAANGLDLRTVEIGSVGGARLQAIGLILDTGTGPDGTINVTVNAEDPRGLLRLLGAMPADGAPLWTQALGATELKGSVTVKTEAEGPVTGFDIGGTSGGFRLEALGSVANAATYEDMEINASVNLKSATSASLAKLAGLTPLGDVGGAASLGLTAMGSLAKGFHFNEINVEAYDALFDYSAATASGGDGRVSLRSTGVAPLMGAFGLPQAELPEGSLVLDAEVKTDGARLSLPVIDGHFGDTPVKGSLTREADGALAAAFDIGDAGLNELLGAAFLNWNGLAPESESGLAAAAPFGLKGELRLNIANLKVDDGLSVPKAQVLIGVAPGETRFSMSGDGDAPGLTLNARGDGKRVIDGKLRLPFDLARDLRLAGGDPIAEGQGWIDLEFQSEGRSPGAVLSGLKGKGAYTVSDLRLTGISIKEFAAALAESKDGAGLNAAFDALRAGGSGLAAGDVAGEITVEAGAATFTPLTITTPEADATVNFSAELAPGVVNSRIKLQLKQPADLPEMAIIYAGSAGALARNEDKTALAALLGNAIMEKNVAELERLQQEEKRLAEEQEKIRLEDEARLVAYYAQRDELRLRSRELKVHAEMRAAAAAETRRKIEAERQVNIAINAAELKQRQRELKVHKRMAQLRPKPEVVDPPIQFAPKPP